MGLSATPAATAMPPVLEQDRERIDQGLARLIELLERDGPLREHPLIARVYRWTRHYLSNGGQRMHGLALLLAYRACGGQDEAMAVTAAAAMQLYHHHTLVHDDIYDEDEMRRGWPTAHRALGGWMAAHAGAGAQATAPTRLFVSGVDRRGAIAAFAYGKVCRALVSHALGRISAAPALVLELHQALDWHDLYDNAAQLADVFHEGGAMPEPAACLSNAHLKTGRLFELCAWMGARLAGAPGSRSEAVQRWAGESALAYQLQDDLEDLEEASEKGQGRGVATDLLHCKPTLLYALAESMASGADLALLQDWRLGRQHGLDTATVMQALHRSGAVEACRSEVRRRLDSALQALDDCRPAWATDDHAAMAAFSEHFVSPAYWRRRLPLPGAGPQELLA